ADGKTKAGTPGAGGGKLGKRNEDPLQIAATDALAGVYHMELQTVAIHSHLHFHRADVGELDGIAEQVKQNLAQPYFIRVDKTRQYRARADLQNQLLGFRHFGNKGNSVLYEGPQLELLG